MTATIVVDGLSKSFGSRVAVSGLHFEVQPGEVFGLLGPNGAGKTTTVRMLSGGLRPSAGRATVCGVSLPLEDEGTSLRQRIGVLTEQPGLYDRLTARENLEFFIRLYELPHRAAWARASSTLARFGLEGREDEPVGGFSKGMRQKLSIVRTLLHEPEVIFLDEPTSGLDPQSARVVRDAVQELAQQGRTLVLCSHNLAEVERLCTRVAIIKGHLRTVATLEVLRGEGSILEILVEGEARAWAAHLEALPWRPHVTAEGRKLKVNLASPESAPDVVAHLTSAGARIHSVMSAARPLEEAYLEMVREVDDT
jgi:ABC-2 type transport system ATP-binding protein